METHLCAKCSGRIIFRRSFWHKKACRRINAARAFPIHLDGCCGQMQLDLS